MSRIKNTAREQQMPADTAVRQETRQASGFASKQALSTNAKVAIVHDWLVGGGAEKVVLELHKMFPEAPIFTSYCTEEWRNKLDNKVVTGYLQYGIFAKLRKYLPFLRMWWFKSLDLSDYDLVVISSGNGEAKHVNVPSTAKHVCYCHTPPHFLWRHYSSYVKNPGFGLFNPLARIGLRLLVSPLKKADYKAAQKVDQFIANSTHIQKDIKKYYGRDSVVIHPPVDVERFQNAAKKTKDRHGYITVGRLVPHKRVDIIVKACTELELPLKVVGRGPELKTLRKLAGPTIKFITNADDNEVAKLMASSEAFIFASFEDFGITPVEAMAAGTPVIAYEAGGALDYVVPGKTGEFFDKQSSESLKQVLGLFKAGKYSIGDINALPQKFTKNNFADKFQKLLKAQ